MGNTKVVKEDVASAFIKLNKLMTSDIINALVDEGVIDFSIHIGQIMGKNGVFIDVNAAVSKITKTNLTEQFNKGFMMKYIKDRINYYNENDPSSVVLEYLNNREIATMTDLDNRILCNEDGTVCAIVLEEFNSYANRSYGFLKKEKEKNDQILETIVEWDSTRDFINETVKQNEQLEVILESWNVIEEFLKYTNNVEVWGL